MEYLNIISEKHKIASITPDELDFKMANEILKQWGYGWKLSQLTVYHDYNNDYLVINRNSPMFETYRDIALAFFEAEPEKWKELEDMAPAELKDTIRVIKSCAEHKHYKVIIKQIYNNYIDSKYYPFLNYMQSKGMTIYNSFVYGVMCGKHEERAKKRKEVL